MSSKTKKAAFAAFFLPDFLVEDLFKREFPEGKLLKLANESLAQTQPSLDAQ
jgi:hypothetical protein